MKFSKLLIVWTAGKNLALPGTLSRNTPPELIIRKTTVEISQNIKFFLAKDETSPRLECKYAVKTGVDNAQINILQHFPLYLDCQINHYEVDLLENSTFKPIAFSSLTLELLQKDQNLDPVFRQLKSWLNYETKPIKADITILGNKTLLRYFRKFNNTSINENTNILEYQSPELKVPYLALSMILLAFLMSHSLNRKGHAGSEKTHSKSLFS